MISANQIKELREKTGAGISDVKKALEESGGDMDKAEKWIERKLGNAAVKKAGRETRAGLVDAYIHSNGRIGALVEIFCETDFVARNPAFKEFVHDIAMHIAAMHLLSSSPDAAEGDEVDFQTLLEQPFVKDQSKTVEQVLNEAIGRFGENIKIGKFVRFEL